MKNRKRKMFPVSAIILITLLVILALVYIIPVIYFHSHFFPHTTVNGKNYSLKTAAKLKENNEQSADNYQLNITDRDGNSYTLSGSDFSYTYVDNQSEEALIGQQNAFAWPAAVFQEHSLSMEGSYSYDEDALETAILSLPLLTAEEYEAPQDAALVLSESGTYEITEEVAGNTPVSDQVVSIIKEAVSSGQRSCTLGDDCYLSPSVTADDEVLSAALEQINAYCSATVTYEIEGYDEVLTSADIAAMLVIGDDYSVSIDEDKIAAYAQELAYKYNTYGDVRSFTTSLGDVIEIGGGDYGWVVSKSGEAAQLLEDIQGCTPVTREPVWEQTAKQSGSDDIGNTYIEIDYTNQHMYYYVDGVLTLESDVVTGKLSNGNGSPDGIFKINYKQSPATLVGEDYSSDVTYFMPFAYNVGFHDASWRSSFGGTIYKSSGSHGCINMPYDAAEQLYSLVEVGTPVVAYYRESVSLTAASSGISNAYSYTGE